MGVAQENHANKESGLLSAGCEKLHTQLTWLRLGGRSPNTAQVSRELKTEKVHSSQDRQQRSWGLSPARAPMRKAAYVGKMAGREETAGRQAVGEPVKKASKRRLSRW